MGGLSIHPILRLLLSVKVEQLHIITLSMKLCRSVVYLSELEITVTMQLPVVRAGQGVVPLTVEYLHGHGEISCT